MAVHDDPPPARASPEGAEVRDAPSTLERWLGSPLRRLALVGVAVVSLTALSATVWADAIESFGREVDHGYLWGARLIFWGLWGLLFEPVLQASRMLSRFLRPRALVVLAHVPLAFAAAFGVSSAERPLMGALLGEPPWLRAGPPAPFAVGRPPRPKGPWGRFPGQMDRGLIVYFALAGMAWGVDAFLRNRQQERRAVGLEVRAAHLQRELSEARLTNLRRQLHPHFLFNSLHSVGGLIRDGRDAAALDALSDLGSLLRAALEQEGRREIPLHEELELVERYLEIEKVRLGERLALETHFEPGVGQTPVPALILLPLVENAITYAVAPRAGGGRLAVSVRRDGEYVALEVLDDGPGFPDEVLRGEAAIPQRDSIGMENTRRRLAALYGDRGTLEISNPDGGGARALVRVPAAGGEA